MKANFLIKALTDLFNGVVELKNIASTRPTKTEAS